MCVVEEEDDDGRGNGVSAEDKGITSVSSSERLGGRGIIEDVGKDEEDGEGYLPQMGDGFTRTNTEVTLVDGDEESREVALKALKFASIDDS